MKSNLERINSYIDLMVRNSSNISSVLASNSFAAVYPRRRGSWRAPRSSGLSTPFLSALQTPRNSHPPWILYIQPHRLMMMSDFGATSRLDDDVANFLDWVTAARSPSGRPRITACIWARCFVRSDGQLLRSCARCTRSTRAKNRGFLAMNVEPASFRRYLRTMQAPSALSWTGSFDRWWIPRREAERVLHDRKTTASGPLCPKVNPWFPEVDGREYVFVTADIETIAGGWSRSRPRTCLCTRGGCCKPI